MADRARLLVALAIGGRAAAEIDGLRRALGSSQVERIPPHVTLVPPTNLAADAAAAVPARLARIAGERPPFRLTLGPASGFPDNRSVLFLAVSESPELTGLRSELLEEAFGEPVRDRRPFVPHITLDSRRADFVDAAMLATFAGYRAEVAISSVQLFRQREQIPTRPWSEEASFDLGAGRLVGRGGLEVRLSAGPLAEGWPVSLAGGWAEGGGRTAGEERYCVAEAEGRTVGVITWRPEAGEATLTRHLVDPAYRGLGIGTKLLAFVESEERARGATGLRIELGEESAAERFYLGRGFQLASPAAGRSELVRRLAP